MFYFLFPTNINFVVKYILFLFLFSELDYYSNIVNVNMSMILSQGHVVFFTEAFSHLFVAFYESHVFQDHTKIQSKEKTMHYLIPNGQVMPLTMYFPSSFHEEFALKLTLRIMVNFQKFTKKQ